MADLYPRWSGRSDALRRVLDLCDERGAKVRWAVVLVRAVSLGGCVEAVGTDRVGAMRRSAHAHTSKRDPFRGVICFKSPNLSKLISPSGRPTTLLWHEWAHVYVAQGHTRAWRDLLRGVGQVAEANRYRTLPPIRSVEEWDRLSGVATAASGPPSLERTNE